MLDFVASAKWEAWNSLGSEMSKQQAMQKYVETVQKFDSKFNPALSPTVPSRSVANQKNAESIEDDDESQPAKVCLFVCVFVYYCLLFIALLFTIDRKPELDLS